MKTKDKSATNKPKLAVGFVGNTLVTFDKSQLPEGDPGDDDFDRAIEYAAKHGLFDEMEKRALENLKAGKVFPMLGAFQNGIWDDKISNDVVAGVFDDMNGEQIQTYFDDLRVRSGKKTSRELGLANNFDW